MENCITYLRKKRSKHQRKYYDHFKNCGKKLTQILDDNMKNRKK